MARYIDEDKLIAHLKDEIKRCEIPLGSRANGKGVAYGTALGLKSAISFAETLPTADVVPKSEVERLITLNSQLEAKVFEERKAKSELAREIFEEIDKTVFADVDFFKELKKKYTEE